MHDKSCNVGLCQTRRFNDKRCKHGNAIFNITNGFDEERVAGSNALSAPDLLHYAVAARLARHDCLFASAVPGDDRHCVAQVPTMLRMSSALWSIDPTVVFAWVLDDDSHAVERTESLNVKWLVNVYAGKQRR